MPKATTNLLFVYRLATLGILYKMHLGMCGGWEKGIEVIVLVDSIPKCMSNVEML
jgi:hypothetical protein